MSQNYANHYRPLTNNRYGNMSAPTDEEVADGNPDVGFAQPTRRRSLEKQVSYNGEKIDHEKCRYPNSIVWTPIPLLTWIFPFIGHMGIAMTNGVIRDFAGPYYVSEDEMAFGKPTKYWRLDLEKVPHGSSAWDKGVIEASNIYKKRMHNLCCDNCHSHVATALDLMQYDNSSSWNMIKLCFLMLVYGRYCGFGAFLKTWLPPMILYGLIIGLVLYFQA